MSAELALLEAEIVALLAPLKKLGLGGAAAGYLRVVDTYAGELDVAGDEAEEAVRERLLSRTPGVLIAIDGAEQQITAVGRRSGVERPEIQVLLCSASLRGPVARKTGAGISADGDPGLYQIEEDVRKILFGASMTQGNAGRLAPAGWKTILHARDLCVARARYTVTRDIARPATVYPKVSKITATESPTAIDEPVVTATVDVRFVLLGPDEGYPAGTVCAYAPVGTFIYLDPIVGRTLVVSGAVNAGNDGRFIVTDFTGGSGAPDEVYFINASAVAEDPSTATISIAAAPVLGMQITPST